VSWRGILPYLFLFLVAACAWTALGWLVSSAYPDHPRAIQTAYVDLFVALAATVGCLLRLLDALFRPAQPAGGPLSYVRHGLVLSALACFGLWLQSLRLLTPLHSALLVGLFVFFELAIVLGSRRA
jgi:hypothetical protein